MAQWSKLTDGNLRGNGKPKGVIALLRQWGLKGIPMGHNIGMASVDLYVRQPMKREDRQWETDAMLSKDVYTGERNRCIECGKYGPLSIITGGHHDLRLCFQWNI